MTSPVFFADILRCLQEVQQELRAQVHCIEILLYLLPLEPPPESLHLRLHQPVLRLLSHVHHHQQLRVPGHDETSRGGRVSMTAEMVAKLRGVRCGKCLVRVSSIGRGRGVLLNCTYDPINYSLVPL